MTEYYDRDLAALDQVEDLLEAYADARLAPSGPVLARMRAHVLAEAAAAAARRGLARPDVAKPSRWVLPRLHVPQRAFALGMAAALTLGTSAAVLAAPPGSPFYNARVAIEAALLPTQADARLTAREHHLDERLAEAEAAAARGDVAGLEAALVAYQAEIDAVVAEVAADGDKLAHLEAMLAKHTAVLEALALRLPDQSAIEHAIDASNKAAAKLKEKGSHGGGRPTDAPGGPQSR